MPLGGEGSAAPDLADALSRIVVLASGAPVIQTLIDAQPDWVWVADRSNLVVAINKSMQSGLGVGADVVIGQRLERFVQVAAAADPSAETEDDLLLRTGDEVQGSERLGRLPDGRFVWWQRWKRVLREPVSGRITGLVGVVRDITPQRELERLALEIADRERWALGSDLHDGVGGLLAGIQMMLKRVQLDLQAEGRTVDDVRDVATLVGKAIDDVRALSRGLAAVHLEKAGLMNAVRQFATQTAAAHAIRCDVIGSLDVADLVEQGDSVHLFRIVQEAVNNALRHGLARNISIAMRAAAQSMELEIADDGVGLRRQPGIESEGIGLTLMRYRVRLLTGSLQLEGRPGGGTRVVCRIPTRSGVPRVAIAMGASASG